MDKIFSDGKLIGFSSFVDGFVPIKVREIQLNDEVRKNPEAVAKRIVRSNQMVEEEDTFDACIERLRFLGKEDKIAEIEVMRFCKKLIPTEEFIKFP